MHYEISPNNPRYRAVVEKKIIPFVKKRCKNEVVEYFSVDSFFQGVHLLYTEAEGFKEYKTGHFPGPAIGYPGGRETDLSVRVHDPFGNVSYSERTYPLGDYVSLNKLRSFNKVLIARYEQKKRDEIAAEEQRKLDEARRLAAIEEMGRRRKIEERPRKIEAHRTQASGILALYKRGAGKSYDFSGYTRRQALQDIYAGNFGPLTGGYEYADQFKIVLNLDLAAGLVMGRLGALNSIAYYAYHQEYAKQCLSNKEIPWEKLIVERTLVSKEVRGFLEFERGRWPLETYEFWVRRPFTGAFSRLYNVGKQNSLDQALVGIPPSLLGEYGRDFEKFLKREGCGSPAVRHFEVNLHLLAGWMSPLQELR